MICGILYIFSFICNNLEFFDSYWSLVPIQRIVMVLRKSEGTISLQENILLITLVSMWSIRIFWTIFQRWSGFPEQDWRLERMKLRYKKRGKYLGFFLYWTVGVGFFLFMNYKAMTLLLYNVVSHLV
jgi:steroid 5-alpha reductase family enzyme